MGYTFEQNNRTIWLPSKTVAELFLRQSALLSDWAGCDLGFHQEMSDVVEIELGPLQVGLKAAIAEYESSNNRSLKVLLHGTLIHLIAIYMRCEGDLAALAVTSNELSSEAVKLLREMPE